MTLTRKQIAEALKQNSPEVYLKSTHDISRREAREIIYQYDLSQKSRRRKSLLLASLLAPLALAAGAYFVYSRAQHHSQLHSSQPVPSPLVNQPEAEYRNPSQSLIDSISPYCEIQKVINPNQRKTFHLFPQVHVGEERNKAGEITAPIANPILIPIQAELLSTLTRINQISPLEAIFCEGLGDKHPKLPDLTSERGRFLEHKEVLSHFQKIPFDSADILFGELNPSTTLYGSAREALFEERAEKFYRDMARRTAEHPEAKNPLELINLDSTARELLKEYGINQDKRSLAYIDESLALLKSKGNIALVVGAKHLSKMYNALKSNPPEGITSIFYYPRTFNSYMGGIFRIDNLPSDYYDISIKLMNAHLAKPESQKKPAK